MADTVLVTVVCPMCDQARELSVPREGYRKWAGGELIQNALPTLSASEREALITGYCDTCWDRMFLPEPLQFREQRSFFDLEGV